VQRPEPQTARKIGTILSTNFPVINAVISFLTSLIVLQHTDNTNREKFVHVLWAPESATGKDKMLLSFFAQQVLTELGALGLGCTQAESILVTRVLQRTQNSAMSGKQRD
jgi:hypothetical protein